MKIIYWSSTGNTEVMAEYIKRGINEAGKDVEVINISDICNPNIKDEELLILGCPAMGDEELESNEFAPFIEANKENFKDKKVALFGSYGWGDGLWLRNWEEDMKSYGAKIVSDSLKINYVPDEDTEIECIEFGKTLAVV